MTSLDRQRLICMPAGASKYADAHANIESEYFHWTVDDSKARAFRVHPRELNADRQKARDCKTSIIIAGTVSLLIYFGHYLSRRFPCFVSMFCPFLYYL